MYLKSLSEVTEKGNFLFLKMYSPEKVEQISTAQCFTVTVSSINQKSNSVSRLQLQVSSLNITPSLGKKGFYFPVHE